MAMQQPVVTGSSCADAIGATVGQGLLRADTPEEFVEALKPLLESPYNAAALGQQARRYVEQECSWQAHLSGIDSCLGSLRAKPPQEVVA